MSWAHIKQLAALNSGLSIGSHTHTHRKLGGLDEDSQREELTTSKKILEAQLGRAIKALAYPYGGPGTFTPQTKVMAAQAGYYLALSSHEGINRFSNLDRYEVRRLSVGSGDSANLIRARCTLHAAFGKSFL
jgi:peptidoglycan/xylan/chitin deacetylase (PgdA/CDA1 family)